MRKLPALLVLVPFAAVAVLSCDEHPTAPETAQAATTGANSATPYASQVAKPPTLPAPVRLAGWVRAYDDVNAVSPGSPGFSLAGCPTGTVAITGGFDVAGTDEFVLMRSNPEAAVDGSSGWMVAILNKSATETIYFRAVVACVSGTLAE